MTRDVTDGGTCPVCDRGFAEHAELERHAESEHDILSDFLQG